MTAWKYFVADSFYTKKVVADFLQAKCDFTPKTAVLRLWASHIHFQRLTPNSLQTSGKVRFSSARDIHVKEENATTFRRRVKNSLLNLSRLWVKVHQILGYVGMAQFVIRISCFPFVDILYHSKNIINLLVLKSQRCRDITQNKQFWGSTSYGDRQTRNFGRPFSNLAHYRTCGKVWLSTVRWPSRTAFEKRKKNIPAKYNDIPRMRAWATISRGASSTHMHHQRL